MSKPLTDNATRLPADLAGALALIESLTVQRDAAEALARDEKDLADGAIKQRNQWRSEMHAAQQMVAELRSVLATGRDIVIDLAISNSHIKWIEDAYDTLEAAASIANRWCLASEHAAAIARLEFLERKVRRAEEVMDVIRSSLPLLVQHYEEEVKS